MSWTSLPWSSAALVLMLCTAGCGLYVSGIGPENGAGGAGGATSSAAHSASHASSTTSGPGSSSGSGVEDCFNNQDDNGNNQTDCADPACGGVARCDDVPVGWTVVHATQGADPSKPAGTCADGKTAQALYYTKPGDPAVCSACKCAMAPAATCTAPQISCTFSNNTCTQPTDAVMQPSTSGCFDVPAANIPSGSNSLGSCTISARGLLMGGGCTTSGGTAPTPPMWGGAVVVCDTPASTGGCASGQSCVPIGASPDGPLCIKKDGTDACPTGWNTLISAFAGGKDNRSCSACTCDAACSGGSYVAHDHVGCVDQSAPVQIAASGCTATPSIFDFAEAAFSVIADAPSVATCGQSKPQGQVDPTGPVQICCK